MTSSVWEAIEAINSMAQLHAGLSPSSCSHLQSFLKETLTFWHKIVKERLTRSPTPHPFYTVALLPFYILCMNCNFFLILCSDLEKVLAHLHWPIISPPAQSLSSTVNNQEVYAQLELLISQLLALQTSYPFISSLHTSCAL